MFLTNNVSSINAIQRIKEVEKVKFTVFTPKTKPLLGVDIGTTFIKAVLLAPIDQQWECRGFACELIPAQAFTERDIVDFDSVSNTLKKIMLKLKLKQQPTIIAVSGASVLSKVIQMPLDLDEQHLEEQIEIEADSLIPYPLDEVYWDFETLGATLNQTDKADVLLTAAHRQLVDNRMTLVREAGMLPKIVDTELDALENLALAQHQQNLTAMQPGAEQVMVHVGSELMHIVVTQANTVTYSKEHQFGLHNFIQDIALTLQLDGQNVLQQLYAGTIDMQWQQQVLPIFHAQLQQHILRALQLMQNQLNNALPTSIKLCGGVAMLPNIAESLSTEMGMEVTLVDPLAHIAVVPELESEQLLAIKPLLCVATGLAMRSLQHGTH
jgi:type IV pilus assembly protein PilM